MRKLSLALGAAFSLTTFWASAALAAPQGFADQAAKFQGEPHGFNLPTLTVSQVVQSAYDDQHVTLVGRLTNYLGDAHYEFADNTGTIVVELDDERNWGHIEKNQQIKIVAEVDRDRRGVTLDVKQAQAAR